MIGGYPRIGNYAVLLISICIRDNRKVVGDGLYCSTGAIITSEITLVDNITIGTNSLVNKSFDCNSIMIAKTPAVSYGMNVMKITFRDNS